MESPWQPNKYLKALNNIMFWFRLFATGQITGFAIADLVRWHFTLLPIYWGALVLIYQSEIREVFNYPWYSMWLNFRVKYF